MKITRARLKQIIKEEMNNLDLDEQLISSEDDAAVEGHAGKTCKEAHPDMTHPEYMKKKLDEAEEVEAEEEPEEEYEEEEEEETDVTD